MPNAADPTTEPERAMALVERSFPDLRPARVRRLGRGWDHDVFLVNDHWVFRFPRHAAAAEAIERERLVMPWIAPRVPLDVAVPTRIGRSVEPPSWPFAGHALLAGETICDAALDAATRAKLAPSLGAFVRALHALDVPTSPTPLGDDPIGRFDVARRNEITLERLSALARTSVLAPSLVERLGRVVEACPVATRLDPVVVHADLHVRNLLVSRDGRLTGVIDWVDLHVGERATDLATAYEVLPADARERFFAAYGDVDDATRGRARWRAATQMTVALAGAIERDDPAFLRACRVALSEIAAG